MDEKKKEKVLLAARQVFLRYGFRRVTMNDLAEAAQMSRPALYLVYPSKEEIFTALIERMYEEKCEEVRQGLDDLHTPQEKLNFAFEVWSVQVFALIQASPDAKDLLESSYEFATEVVTNAYAEFTALVAGILESTVTNKSLTAYQIAEVMVSALPGFKQAAENIEQLRRLIANLIALVLSDAPAAEDALV